MVAAFVVWQGESGDDRHFVRYILIMMFERTTVVATMLALIVTVSLAQTPHRDPDLEQLRGEIARLRSSLDRVRSQARTAEEQLQLIELELAINEREVDMAREVQSKLERENVAIQARVDGLNAKIALDRQFLSRRIAMLYRFGALGYLRIILSVDGKRNPFEAAAMLSYIVSRDARAVTQVQTTRETLRLQLAELSAQSARIDQVRRVVENRTRAVAQTRLEKARFLEKLRLENDSSSRRLVDLEEKARRLERLFTLLYGRNDPRRFVGARISEFQGALEWPLKGEVLEGFGKQRNLKFSTVTVSNGLKIGAKPGIEVRAVFQGTVLFSQWFKGYGNLVILDHGNRIFSLYGNTQNPRVAVGDRVVPRQVIANVAPVESGESSYLYFEIREDNKPNDPHRWLR